jgi:hypothetical protein
MIQLHNIRPGQRVTFVMSHDATAMNDKMRKGGRGDNIANPLWGRVSRVIHVAGNVAGEETYANVLLKRTGETPAGTRPPVWQATDAPCVVALISNPARLGVPIVNRTTQRCELFVDGRPATETEVALFSQWKKTSNSENPTGFAILGAENLVNAE